MATRTAGDPASGSTDWTWRTTTALDEHERAAIRGLVAKVNRSYSISALSDDGRTTLADGSSDESDPTRHGLVTGPDGTLEGYVQLRRNPPTCEAVLTPAAAATPATRFLLADLVQRADGPVHIWTRGADDPAAILVREIGALPARELLKLQVELTEPPDPAPRVPPDFRLRTFRPGRDEEAWLTANRAAFASLPDQASWTSRSLGLRLAEPWFRPEGFFLLFDRRDRIAGFHWTKIHQPWSTDPTPGAHAVRRLESIGEVYVLGLIPQYRGRGLADLLLRTGIGYLHRHGINTVVLYVDAANPPALRLYERFGFRLLSIERQFLIDGGRVIRTVES